MIDLCFERQAGVKFLEVLQKLRLSESHFGLFLVMAWGAEKPGGRIVVTIKRAARDGADLFFSKRRFSCFKRRIHFGLQNAEGTPTLSRFRPKSHTQRNAAANPRTEGKAAIQRKRAAPAVSIRNPSHEGSNQNDNAKKAVPTASEATVVSRLLCSSVRCPVPGLGAAIKFLTNARGLDLHLYHLPKSKQERTARNSSLKLDVVERRRSVPLCSFKTEQTETTNRMIPLACKEVEDENDDEDEDD